jgi:hypothetical protein
MRLELSDNAFDIRFGVSVSLIDGLEAEVIPFVDSPQVYELVVREQN